MKTAKIESEDMRQLYLDINAKLSYANQYQKTVHNILLEVKDFLLPAAEDITSVVDDGDDVGRRVPRGGFKNMKGLIKFISDVESSKEVSIYI